MKKIDENFNKVFEGMSDVFDEMFTKIDKELNKEDNDGKVHLDYKNIQTHINNASEVISDEFDTILCITRGGLVPAGLLAYQLGIKNIVNINISSYEDDNSQGTIDLEKLSKKEIKILSKAKGILIVDDIIDTGDTVQALAIYLNELQVAGKIVCNNIEMFALVTKQVDKCSYYVYNMEGDDRWIEFPWSIGMS
jgi:xanthine phosphoribosyltransferase